MRCPASLTRFRQPLSSPPSLSRVPGHRRHAKRRLIARLPTVGASGAAAFGDASGSPEEEPVQVLPRLNEKDPFKVLGIPPDSDFEEVQQARNFLVEEYAAHEASREHVELAYEKIVSQSFRSRQKKGFRPGRGKRGERFQYEAPPTVLDRIKGLFDPSVTVSSAVRDLIMYTAVALWSALTVPRNAAATMITFGYAVFRTTMKRKLRNPDGPYFGDSPVFGAVLVNLLAMGLALFVASSAQAYFPFWRYDINEIRAGAFLITFLMCPLNIFLK